MTYVPAWMPQPDAAYAIKAAKAIGFATVVLADAAQPAVSHIPIYVDHDGSSKATVLRFHIAAQNPMVKRLKDGRRVLVIFHGTNGYISPRWYNHENVPTWNYAAVHMSGLATALSEEELRAHVLELVRNFEPELTPRDEFIDECIQWIRGFTIIDPAIEPVFKLSQDKNEESFNGVIEGLRGRNRHADTTLAEEMISLKEHLSRSSTV